MDERHYVISLAAASDAQAVLRLIALLYVDEKIPLRAEAMQAALLKLLSDPALGFVLMARERAGSEVIAYGVATLGYDVEFAGTDAFITDLYVEHAHRGRGLGQRLLDALVEALRARDVKAVHLMVRPENEKAHALYASKGFADVPRVLMTKILAP
jgi:ribosomal protein S18 acetylase RimI-like enzyme